MTEPLRSWNIEDFLDSMSPATRRNHQRYMRVVFIQMRLARLLRWPSWPIINIVWVFWVNLMDEGLVATIKPRWGALTFTYLNDGIRPTLYHTLLTLVRPDTPIYTHGAPRNRKEAQEQ